MLLESQRTKNQQRQLAVPTSSLGGAYSSQQMQEYGRDVAEIERNECALLCEMTPAEILLAAGEMTAEELRCVAAVLAGCARAIRSRP
jgi:hypothetical protein